MSTLIPRESRTMFPELFDWLGLPLTTTRQQAWQTIRLEDFVEEGRYVVRAELPDIDPERDVEITVDNGILTIHAERREEHKDQYRSEFRYGTFTRSIALPQGTDEKDVTATYDKGILEVSVKLAERKPEGRRITVARPGQKK
jgi:HSP20 family protein